MNIDFGSNDVRRMPVYLVIDTSRSQEGAPIQGLEQGIQSLRNELLVLPQAVEMVHMGVITFGGVPQELVPLTSVEGFKAPRLEARGATMLGGGLRLLCQALKQDIIPARGDRKGDYSALVFLIVASVPEDCWQADWEDLYAQCQSQLGSVIALGCGDRVDFDSLRLITPNVLAMPDVTADNLRVFLRWISQPAASTPDPTELSPESFLQSIPAQPVSVQEKEPMNIDFGSNDVRRMPVYLLLDSSGSMAGAPIQGVEQGVQLLRNELLSLPQAVEMVHIGVITFASKADQVVPLTPVTTFSPPSLSAGGTTALGDALRKLAKALDNEITPTTAEKKGDYKPLVFLLTDGEPTDDWEPALHTLNSRQEKKVGSMIALGCGDGVNFDILRQITPNVLAMPDATADNIRAFFRWVSASVKTASVSAAGAAVGAGAALPPPPAGFQIVL